MRHLNRKQPGHGFRIVARQTGAANVSRNTGGEFANQTGLRTGRLSLLLCAFAENAASLLFYSGNVSVQRRYRDE